MHKFAEWFSGETEKATKQRSLSPNCVALGSLFQLAPSPSLTQSQRLLPSAKKVSPRCITPNDAMLHLGNTVHYHRKRSPSDNKLNEVISQGSQRVGRVFWGRWVLRVPATTVWRVLPQAWVEASPVFTQNTGGRNGSRNQISWDDSRQSIKVQIYATLLCTCIYRVLGKSHILSL